MANSVAGVIEWVTLYWAATNAVDADAIADWLRERVGAKMAVRGLFLERYD